MEHLKVAVSSKTPPPSEEATDIQFLSKMFERLHLSGIVDKIVEGTLGETETTEGHLENLTQRGKRLRASLIILAKANHHKNFMENCLKSRRPPKSMTLWCKPYIYHSNSQVEREWRDILQQGSLKLVSILIKHYAVLIISEKETIAQIKKTVNATIQTVTDQETKHQLIRQWKQITRQAIEEATTLSGSLRATRERKLAPLAPRMRGRGERGEDSLITRKESSREGEDPVRVLIDVLLEYQKSESAPRQPVPSTHHHQDRRVATDRHQRRGREYGRKL